MRLCNGRAGRRFQVRGAEGAKTQGASKRAWLRTSRSTFLSAQVGRQSGKHKQQRGEVQVHRRDCICRDSGRRCTGREAAGRTERRGRSGLEGHSKSIGAARDAGDNGNVLDYVALQPATQQRRSGTRRATRATSWRKQRGHRDQRQQQRGRGQLIGRTRNSLPEFPRQQPRASRPLFTFKMHKHPRETRRPSTSHAKKLTGCGATTFASAHKN